MLRIFFLLKFGAATRQSTFFCSISICSTFSIVQCIISSTLLLCLVVLLCTCTRTLWQTLNNSTFRPSDSYLLWYH
jgi:hypothetical protein